MSYEVGSVTLHFTDEETLYDEAACPMEMCLNQSPKLKTPFNHPAKATVKAVSPPFNLS